MVLHIHRFNQLQIEDMQEKKSVLNMQFFSCNFSVNNNLCSTYIVLGIISNMEMMQSTLEDEHRLHEMLCHFV